MRQPSESDPMSGPNGSSMWILSTAIVITVLFVSLALYFSRSKADTSSSGNTTANITNVAPTVGAVKVSVASAPEGTISTESGATGYDGASTILTTNDAITPISDSTKTFYIDVIAQDPNGANTIDPDIAAGSMAWSVKLKYGTGIDCSNPSNCSSAPMTACRMVAKFGSTIQVRCTLAAEYYAIANSLWNATVTITDDSGLAMTMPASSGSVTVDPVLGYTISSSSVNFGNITLPYNAANGFLNSNVNKALVLQNTANIAITKINVSSSAMICDGLGSIPANDIGFGAVQLTSMVGFKAHTGPLGGTLSDSYVSGTSDGRSTAFGLAVQANPTSPTHTTLYNHIVAVPLATAGSCTGNIDLTPNN